MPVFKENRDKEAAGGSNTSKTRHPLSTCQIPGACVLKAFQNETKIRKLSQRHMKDWSHLKASEPLLSPPYFKLTCFDIMASSPQTHLNTKFKTETTTTDYPVRIFRAIQKNGESEVTKDFTVYRPKIVG